MPLDSKAVYEDLYSKGYGIQYPEGHIIRIYEFFLKGELGLDGSVGQRVLDFGCGNGTHALYFRSKGFEVYGVDVSEHAIALAKNRLPEIAENFLTINPGEDLSKLYPAGSFDLIVANQSLHFLGEGALRATIQQMHDLLSDHGVIVASMHSTKSYFHDLNVHGRAEEDGLQQVVHRGRLHWDDYFVNFTSGKQEMRQRFSSFNPVFVGEYSMEIREGYSHLFYFIGRKVG